MRPNPQDVKCADGALGNDLMRGGPPSGGSLRVYAPSAYSGHLSGYACGMELTQLRLFDPPSATISAVARFTRGCIRCGEDIRPGQRMAKVEERFWVHDWCGDGPASEHPGFTEAG